MLLAVAGALAIPATLSIRRAARRDVPTILRLIRGLAEYERLAPQMEATVERIRRHGFGRPRYFETLICRRGRTPIGFALYYFTYSTFLGRPTLYLEDLFVLPRRAATAPARRRLRRSRRSPCDPAAAPWSGPSPAGKPPPTAFTRSSG